MKKMIYNTFDRLVMLMMVVAYADALIAQPTLKSLAFIGLFAVGGLLLYISQEVEDDKQS